MSNPPTTPPRTTRGKASRVQPSSQAAFEAEFVTIAEIATRTGYHRISVNQQVGRNLPQPFAIVNGGYVWRRVDIEPVICAMVLRAQGERALAAAQAATPQAVEA